MANYSDENQLSATMELRLCHCRTCDAEGPVLVSMENYRCGLPNPCFACDGPLEIMGAGAVDEWGELKLQPFNHSCECGKFNAVCDWEAMNCPRCGRRLEGEPA